MKMGRVGLVPMGVTPGEEFTEIHSTLSIITHMYHIPKLL